MSRRLPNLNQLRAFEAAARLGSFKAAADELFVTQAAISHQIKALEEHYGRLLFQRLNREVRLTDSASRLASELSQSLDRIADASQQFKSKELSGLLRLSATPFYANRMIIPYLDDFLDKYPDLQIEFDFSYKIVDFLEDRIDGALRYGPSGEEMRLIHLDRVSPVASPSLVKDFKLPMSPDQIAGCPLAAVEGQERYWTEWFEEAGFEGAVHISSRHEQRALAFDFALAGNAVVLADIPLVRNELGNGSIVRLSDTEIVLDRGIHLAEPNSAYKDARLAAFGDWLSGQVRDL